MKEYMKKVMEWTDTQLDSVNTRGIGRAKSRVNLQQSIRTSKMMYDWLNVGKQKSKMGKEGRCPCCGECEEDQLHLYHCKNEEMQNSLKEAMIKAKSSF